MTIICLIEGTDLQGYEALQDDSYNKLESKLKLQRELVEHRELLVPIEVISFAPAVDMSPDSGTKGYPIANAQDLGSKLTASGATWERADLFEATLAAIDSTSAIRQTRTKRPAESPDSRGARLKQLEGSIAALDGMQRKAVVETVEGVQRIRGLAGSGKTIVLARKAAYLHAQHPDWRIAVTFNTRSLKALFQRLIASFFLQQTNEEPNWDQLRIVNAWGAPGANRRDGIYFEFCHTHGLSYFDFQSARRTLGAQDTFSKACALALSQAEELRPQYDAILIDEAQDFSPAFLRLCHAFLREPKRLVYAYDELQNLRDESLPSPERIFEDMPEAASGNGRVQASNEPDSADIILRKCYRNSRPLLVTAHALGFGIYREAPTGADTGLIQMFDNANLWEDVGYRVREGRLADNEPVVLQRDETTSPRFLEDHSDLSDLLQFKVFESDAEQAEWVATQIKANIEDEELRHDDIVVINPDPTSTRANVGPIRAMLADMGIQSHIAGVDTDPDVFYMSGTPSVTFTGIFRAKGNEAGMVYIINAQDCTTSAINLATVRNRLFTAITRSKAWIRVVGFGNRMQPLMKEYEELRKRDFELDFVYPGATLRERLKIVHRDMTKSEKRRLEGGRRRFAELIESLESGEMRTEDLDKMDVLKLRELLDD